MVYYSSNKGPKAAYATCIMALIAGGVVEGRLADRSRVVKNRVDNGVYDRFRDNGVPIEGPGYKGTRDRDTIEAFRKQASKPKKRVLPKKKKEEESATDRHFVADVVTKAMRGFVAQKEEDAGGKVGTTEGFEAYHEGRVRTDGDNDHDHDGRRLGSQLTGCCYTYEGYDAESMCALYGNDCENVNAEGSGDSGDGDCTAAGLSFIGISFSVNTGNGNPYSYQLCDQFPMENLIDRDYDYVMSLDEDGWLVGGGYKAFDYSGKMPYIDSSHTELLRIGNLDPDSGGTSIDQVYSAMESISFSPISVYPEYLKGGGGHKSGDDDDSGVPSSDITFIVSIVDTYEDDSSYSGYEQFLDDLFDALDAQGSGPCMDDHDTDPHVSMSRGVKFKSSWHQQQYMYETNLEVSVWQAMYPYGVVIGSSGYASFPPGRSGTRVDVGYGNLYFFFDRANITKAFYPNRGLTDDESYYSTLFETTDTSTYYSSTTDISFDYSGSGGDDNEYEHNPYSWKATMAMHDMTDGWDLPPNCEQEGETFFGIPLSRKSESTLQSTSTFQNQFDFDYVVDRNYTYVSGFGTNHGWLVGEEVSNAMGSIVDKDTSHIPLFYTGTTNAAMGGISLSNLIRIAQNIEFGPLYIKPAFVFVDDNGHYKLQFEADSSSALGYLYDTLCKELGITWNYESPSNQFDAYTNCAMHAAGDRSKYGCGPENSNTGGFCPQVTLAYSVRFNSEDDAATFVAQANNYINYWRDLYPSGVAVGTSKFCPDGGCLGLFLNRCDLYSVFKPDLGGSWVEYNGASMAPTYSPAPTWSGGCSEPHNFHLDKCFHRNKSSARPALMAWDSLGSVGQFSIVLISFMAITLVMSLFLARARKKRRRGESYMAFFVRDSFRGKRKRRSKKRSLRSKKTGDLDEAMMDDTKSRRSNRSKRSASRSSRSHSKSTRRSKSRSRVTALDSKSIQPSVSGRTKGRSRSKSKTRSSGLMGSEKVSVQGGQSRLV